MPVTNFATFEAAARAALAFLHQHMGYDLWMTVRFDGEDWVVLQAEDHGLGVREGSTLRWVGSSSSRMVVQSGPASGQRRPGEEALPRHVPVGATVSAPLLRGNGSLFGALCGLRRASHPGTGGADQPLPDQPLLDLIASMLGALLRLEADGAAASGERARPGPHPEGLIGMYERRAFVQLLAMEEERCRRFGHPAAIVSLAPDWLMFAPDHPGQPSGDIFLRRVVAALRRVVVAGDLVARVGGGEIVILAVECGRHRAEALQQRLRSVLSDVGIAASVGLAMRSPAIGLVRAWELAEYEMQADRRRRKSAAPASEMVPTTVRSRMRGDPRAEPPSSGGLTLRPHLSLPPRGLSVAPRPAPSCAPTTRPGPRRSCPV